MNGRCDQCVFWNKEEGRRIADVGLCSKAQALWEVTGWNEKWNEPGYNEEPERVLLTEYQDLKMFVQDGSDYRAILLTKPDFFCAHFEETFK